MEQPTQIILTRSFLYDELRRKNKRDVGMSVSWTVFFMLLCPWVCLACVFSVTSVRHPFMWFLSALVFCFCTVPMFGSWHVLIRSIRERRWLEKGEYQVVVKALEAKLIRDVRFRERRKHVPFKVAFMAFYQSMFMQDVCLLYFGEYGIAETKRTVLQICSEGELFYLVTYRGKRPIKLAYAAKMCDCPEVD